MRNWFFGVFFSPQDNNTGGGGGLKPVEEINERALLDSVDNKKDKKDKKEGVEEEEEEDKEEEVKDKKKKGDEGDEVDEEEKEEQDEETEESDELDEEANEDDEELDEGDEVEDEEELESDTLYQALKKHDKDIFKKVPELRKVVFREQKFTEIFPTPEDAALADKRSKLLGDFEKSIFSGDSKKLFTSLNNNQKALRNFVSGIIPTLGEIDKNLVAEMMAPEIKKVIRTAVKSGNDILKQSALNLHWFVFGDQEVDKEVGLVQERKSEKEDELEKREREIFERQLNSFNEDVKETGFRKAKGLIGAAFKDSDMSELQKRHLVNEIFDRILTSLDKDSRYMGHMRNLWNQAAEQGFTSRNKESLISAFLSRVKVLTPQVRQKVLQEARISFKNGNTKDKKKARRVPSSGSSGSGSIGRLDPKKIDWSKTSEEDILHGKSPTYKN